MNRYSKKSLKIRGEISRNLQIVFDTILPLMDHSLVCGYRGPAAQERAFAEGKSTKHYPNSRHNKLPLPVTAVDAQPYPYKEEDKEQAIYFAGYVMGVADMLFKLGEISRKIHNLGFTKLGDWCHFEEVL